MTKFLKSKSAKLALGLVAIAAFAFVGVRSANATITMILRQGMTNDQVKEVQQYLNTHGFMVSSTGAGSPGYESRYFGTKTKAAVMAFQTANGLQAVGQVGPQTRALINAGGGGTNTGGNLPPGCTTTAGFSPITGQPCNGGTTTQTGPVTAMIATNNPASGTLVAGQATADLAHFAFSGNGTVTNVTLKRIGVSADSTPSNVYLFDGATRLTDASSVANNGIVTFNVPAGIFTVNGSKTISVKSDITSGTSGQTVGMMLSSFTTSGAAAATTANVSGNVHTIASATVATVTAATITPSGATLNPGAGVTLWQSTLTIGQRDVWMKRFALRNVGSAPASSFQNFKLFVNGVQVATAAGMDSMGYVTFDMSTAPISLVAGSRVVRVDADIVSGASRTVQLSLRQAADVDFVDSSFGVNVRPAIDTSGVASGTALPWAPSPANTISGSSGGSLTIEKDVTSPSTNLVNAGTDVNLGTFKVTAYGEPIKIETLRATFTSSDSGISELRNGRILINGVQYGSTATLNEDSHSAPAYTSYTLNYTVMPGTPVMVELHADIYDNDGTDSITAGTDTLIGVIAAGSSNAIRQDSLGSFTAPATAVSANTLTIASTSIQLTKNATYANQSVVLPATNFKIGSYNLAGSSVEDVLLTTLSFDVDEVTVSADDFNESDITNMYVVVKNSSGAIVAQPSPLATVSAADNNFSVNYTLPKNQNLTIELYGNLGSTATVAEKFRTDLTVTGTSMVSGTAVTATSADTIGQTITYGTASITATVGASSPVTGIVSDNQTVETGTFKFAAVTSSYNITDVTVDISGTGASTIVENVMLYDGGTLIATQPGGATAATFSGLTWNIPANQNKELSVKLQLGTVGVGAGTSESVLTTAITAFTATNTSTGVSAAGTESNPTAAALYAFAAIPTITEQTINGTLSNVSNKPLIKFKIDAVGGSIGWSQLYFDVTKDAATLIASSTTAGVKLWDVTGGGNTEVAGTFTNSASLFTGCCSAATGTILFVPTAEQQVSTTKTYELRGTISAADADGDFVTVTIANDSSAIVALDSRNDLQTADSDAPIIWSDLSAASHATSTDDWTTDFGVKNLPVSGSLNW